MTSQNIVSRVVDVLTEQSFRKSSSNLSRLYRETKTIIFETTDVSPSNIYLIREKQKRLIIKLHRIEEFEKLDEGLLRTGSLLGFLGKVKQYGNRVDTDVSKLKSLSSPLENETDEKQRHKIMGQIKRVDSDVLQGLRKMVMYSSLISVSGLIGLDKSLVKRLKQRRR